MDNSLSSTIFSSFSILSTTNISIVIPVRDEELYIKRTLNSLSNQVNEFGKPYDKEEFEILILANNCTDNSVAYIKDFQNAHPLLQIYLEEISLPAAQANIGFVRRSLMDAAYLRLCENGEGIIMTTDGDTCVNEDWIVQTKLEISRGADAVGGRILLYPEELELIDPSTKNYYYKDEQYQLLLANLEETLLKNKSSVSTHHQHFNASFAITTSCYKKSGGVPNVTQLEDCALFERLQQIDANVKHSNAVVVHTSARFMGRVEIGLSYQLNIWKNLELDGTDFIVESYESILNRLTIKKRLMKLWKSRDDFSDNLYQVIEKIIGSSISPDLFESFNNGNYFGSFFSEMMSLEKCELTSIYPPADIDSTIEKLQNVLTDYQLPTFSQTSMR